MLPSTVFIRAADALHLQCAQENGFSVVYSHDRQLLASALQFGLVGTDII
jgi:predicted nucleic acid-binding protein